MPRIKYTALVSAMAGKSGGSVFAKNKGGDYFRNNKSGFKLKSNLQAKTQARFRSVSAQWANLSQEDRDAWNSVAPTIPSKNIFGDSKILNGYEYFLKINAAMVIRNLPMFNNPRTIQPVPSMSDIGWVTPDMYLYQPLFGFGGLSSIPVNSNLTLTSDDHPICPSGAGDMFLMTRFNISNVENLFTQGFPEFSVEIANSDETRKYNVQFNYDDPDQAIVSIQYTGPSDSLLCEYTLPKTILKGQNVLSFTNDTTNVGQFIAYCNGVLLELQNSQITGAFSSFIISRLVVYQTKRTVNPNLIITDVRYYKVRPTPDYMALYSKGYQDGTESLILQMPKNKNDNFELYGTLQFITNMRLEVDTISTPVINAVATLEFTVVPTIIFAYLCGESSNFSIELLVSNPVNAGRSLSSCNLSQVTAIELTNSESLEVTEEIQNRYPFFSNNNTFQMAYRIFDTTSGIVYTKKPVPNTGGVHRFKAGSALTEKVKP